MSSSESYQDAVERWRVSTTLDVAQNSDSRVLRQFIDDDLPNHLGGDGVSLAICGAFGNDDDIQTLAGRTFLFVVRMKVVSKTFLNPE